MIKLVAFVASMLLVVGCGDKTIEKKYNNSDQLKERYSKIKNEDGIMVKHGLHTVWSRTGNVIKVENYNNGLLDSIQTYWYTKDKKEHEINYDKGVKNGVETWWYPGGLKKSETTWDSGKIVGTQTKWNSSGVKEYEAIYVDGLKDGIESEWFSDGALKNQTGWEAGKRHGKDTEWCFDADEKGNHIKGHERFWSQDTQVKTEKWWSCDFNGNISSKMYYKNGLLHGKYTAYWVAGPYKGRVMESATYNNGKENLKTKKRYYNPDDERKSPKSTPFIGLTSKEKKALKMQK